MFACRGRQVLIPDFTDHKTMAVCRSRDGAQNQIPSLQQAVRWHLRPDIFGVGGCDRAIPQHIGPSQYAGSTWLAS